MTEEGRNLQGTIRTLALLVAALTGVCGAVVHAQDNATAGAQSDALTLPEAVCKDYAKTVRAYYEYVNNEEFSKASKCLQEFKKELDKSAKNFKVDSLLAKVEDFRRILLEGGIPDKPDVKVGSFARADFRLVDLGPSPLEVGATDKELKGVFDGKFKVLLSYPQDCAKVIYPVVLALHDIPDETNKPLGEMTKSSAIVERVTQWAKSAYPAEMLASTIVIVPIMDYLTIGSSGLTASRPRWDSFEGRNWTLRGLAATVLTATLHDPARIFFDGHGSGSSAAMLLCSLYPSLQTGAIVRGQAPEKIRFDNCSGLPFLFVGSAAKDFVDAWKTRPGFENLLQSETLDAATLSKFLRDHPKNYSPKKVEIQTDNLAFGCAYWASITDIDNLNTKLPLANLIAEIDGGTNTISVTTNAKVKSFVIYLNDRLLDLGKEIRIVHKHDGAEEAVVRFQGLKERSLADLLDFGFRNPHGNVGEVYVTSVRVDIPKPKANS